MSGKSFPKLNKQQAKLVINKIRDVLGQEITGILDKSAINPDHMVRFQYISNLCKNTREQMQISLKHVSEKLKIPQYRLKDIEDTSLKTIMPDVLEKYVEFLGLTDAFRDWLKDNRDIYKSLQENPAT